MADLREIGPTFYFAPPRVLENLLTRVMIRMEDAGVIKRKMFHYFMRRRAALRRVLNGQPVPLSGRLLYGIGDMLVYGPLKNVLGMSRVRVAYTAGEAIGPELFDFYRSIGLNLKQLYGQTEAFLYVTVQPDGEIYSDTVPGLPNVEIRIADTARCCSSRRHVRRVLQGSRQDRRDHDAGRLCDDRRRRLLRREDRASQDHRPRQGCRKLNDGTLFAPKYIENKLKFFPTSAKRWRSATAATSSA